MTKEMSYPSIYLVLLVVLCPAFVYLHAVPMFKAHRVHPSPSSVTLRLVPSEAIVYPGDTVTFECRTPDNVSLSWEAPWVRQYEVSRGVKEENPGPAIFYSRITVRGAQKSMNGEIACLVDGGKERVYAVLVVDESRGGVWACRTSVDCATESATCRDGVCECPRNHVRLRLKGANRDICRQMIYSLYDPCVNDEQCSYLVDPKSVCKSVCVCAAWARDRRGKCVSITEIAYTRSQEMYRVGLIAVTCIIILIVAVSLWITLKRSCSSSSGRSRSSSQRDPNFSNRPSIDVTMDKPPSYDDVLVTTGAQDTMPGTISSPPNFKEALKHCMTAKRLLRQVSAPAGQLLQQPPPPAPTDDVKKASQAK